MHDGCAVLGRLCVVSLNIVRLWWSSSRQVPCRPLIRLESAKGQAYLGVSTERITRPIDTVPPVREEPEGSRCRAPVARPATGETDRNVLVSSPMQAFARSGDWGDCTDCPPWAGQLFEEGNPAAAAAGLPFSFADPPGVLPSDGHSALRSAAPAVALPQTGCRGWKRGCHHADCGRACPQRAD